VFDARSSLIAAAVLIFGLVVLIILYLYLNAWRKTTAKLIEDNLRRTGRLPGGYHEVTAKVRVGTRGALAGGGGSAGGELTLSGPGVVTTGQISEDYVAKLDGHPVTVTWTAEGHGRLSTPSGPTTKLTTSAPGIVHIKGEYNGKDVAVDVVSLDNLASEGKVPLIGGGYGGITIAILAVTVAAALTVLNLLPGAVLATLLGTVVSYFFVQRSSSDPSK